MAMKAVVVLGCLVLTFVPAVATGAAGGPSPGLIQGWDGVKAAGGAVRYVALPIGPSTGVAAVRVNGGRVLRYTSVRGNFGVPAVTFSGDAGGVSSDGRVLVLATWAGGSRTRFAIFDALRLRLRRVIVLHGQYSFDALSPAGRTMYLIQYFGNGVHYRVRAYDLAHLRIVAKPVVDPKEPAPMRGSPVARTSGHAGRWAYTLYRGGRMPFVHALDTVARKAVCVDLPRAGDRLVLRGSRLVVLKALRKVAVVDTRTLRVVGSST
jgi:hypothetical protein